MKGTSPRIETLLNRRTLVSLILLLVAFLVRAWGLSEVGLWHDEALSHFYASQSPAWLLEKSATDLNHPPLFFLLLRAWIHLVPGFSQFWVELLNVVFGSLTVWVTWLWGNLVLRRSTALVVALLHALHPWAVHFSGELRMYALAGFSVCVLGYFSTRLMVRSQGGFIDWLGWSLAGLVSVYTHSFTVLFLGVTIPFVLAYGSGSRIHKSLAVGLLALLYVPWSIPVLLQVTKITSDYWLPPFHGHYLLILFFFLGGWIGEKSMGLAGFLKSLILAVGVGFPALIGFWKRCDRVSRFLACLILVPLGLVTLSSLLGQSVFLYRVFTPLVPVMLLLAGAGYDYLGGELLFVLLLVYGVFLGWELTMYRTHPPRQYARTVARGLEEYLADGQYVVHTSPYSYFPSRFYHGNDPREKLLVKGSGQRSAQLTREELNQLLAERPVIVVTHGLQLPGWMSVNIQSAPERNCWERERTFCSMVLPKRTHVDLNLPHSNSPH